MNLNTTISLLLAVILVTSCANQNVADVPATENVKTANTFDANAVAVAMCDCMENALQDNKTNSKANTPTIAVLQKQCEKRGIVAFGDFKNDPTKVSEVNALINKNCGNLAAANNSPLQHQARAATTKTTQQKTQQQMIDFKGDKSEKPLKQPRKPKNTPKLEIEIE